MAELKRTFSKAKMNKDLDERLVPPGEYRDANNIEIATSEGSNVGTAQSVYGNIECTQTTTVNPDFSHHTGLTSATVGSPAFCVGAIADEKNNKIYSLISDGLWFVEGSSYDDNHYVAVSSDYILEYDLVGSTPSLSKTSTPLKERYWLITFSAEVAVKMTAPETPSIPAICAKPESVPIKK